MDINWSQLVLSEAFFQRLNSLVRRSIVEEAIADEAVTFTIECLSANNWEKCRSYTGKSSPETFLYSLSSNLIIDYSRKVYGRQRPPTWLKRKGPLWVSIWKQLCLDRQSPQTVIDTHAEDASHDRSMLQEIMTCIKAQLPWCGVSARPESLDDETQTPVEPAGTGTADNSEREVFDEALEFAHLLLGESGDSDTLNPASDQADSIYDVLRAIELTAEEKLILKMHFCDGLNFSAIARALGMAKHQPVRLIEKVIQRARTALSDYGMEW